jgi:hypothetical protein
MVGGLGMASAEVFPLLRHLHEVLASRGFIVRYFDYAPEAGPPNYYEVGDTFASTIVEVGALLAGEVELWRQLGQVRLVVIAHSLGGMIAAHWASGLVGQDELLRRLFVATVASPIRLPIRDLLGLGEHADYIIHALEGYNIEGLTTRVRLGCLCGSDDEYVPVEYASYPLGGPEHPAYQRTLTIGTLPEGAETTLKHNYLCLFPEVRDELTRWIDSELAR